MNDWPDDDEVDEDTVDVFPLDKDKLEQVAQIVLLIRRRLPSLEPRDIRTASAVLAGLERLPSQTQGLHVVFGFRTANRGGNFGWADIELDSSEMRLSVGEHFYDPDVGGDTSTRTIFQAICGSWESEGDIADWLEEASHLFRDGSPSIEDNSDYAEIDWDTTDYGD